MDAKRKLISVVISGFDVSPFVGCHNGRRVYSDAAPGKCLPGVVTGLTCNTECNAPPCQRRERRHRRERRERKPMTPSTRLMLAQGGLITSHQRRLALLFFYLRCNRIPRVG